MKMRYKFYTVFLVLVLASFRTNLPVTYKLIIFEGSDWCGNCRRLEKNILSDTTFLAFLKSNAIVAEKIDFPQHKKINKEQKMYNERMAEKYGFEGVYPTLILSLPDTVIYEKLAYANQSTAEMIDQIKQKMQKLK